MTDEMDEVLAQLAEDPNFEPAKPSEYDEEVVEVTIPGKFLKPKEEENDGQ